MRFLPVGRDALLVECADLAQVRALHATVRQRRVSARDVVPAARTLLLDGVRSPAALADEIAGWELEAPDVEDAPLVELPITYDGPDLAFVAERWGISTEEVASLHEGTEFVVAFCGFAPGFAYLAGLPEERAVPRRESPRAQVPAGSVGLAGSFTGVYPRSSPGGWQLIGRTDALLWQPDREQPALLAPGTRVVFVRG